MSPENAVIAMRSAPLPALLGTSLVLLIAAPGARAAADAPESAFGPDHAPEMCGCWPSLGAAAAPTTGQGTASAGRRTSLYSQTTAWETDTGAPFDMARLRGRPSIVSLFYTSCHVACPATLKALLDVERRLPRDSSVAIVLVTIDPATDTPRRLAACRAEWLLPGRFVLLRGSTGATRSLADAAGIVFRQESSRLVHVPKIVVLDEQGAAVASFPGSRADPGDIAKAALEAESDGARAALRPPMTLPQG